MSCMCPACMEEHSIPDGCPDVTICTECRCLFYTHTGLPLEEDETKHKFIKHDGWLEYVPPRIYGAQ